MKLLKPHWVTHDDGQSIFSIAIHPDGARFATGGQAQDGSGKVIIWNSAPVFSHKVETSRSVPKIFTVLTNHLGCVNCVRWSRDGKYLASGGDDSIIIIWTMKYKGQQKVTFGTDTPVHEHWSCSHMLRGHNGDILDLNWSHDQHYLASCSVDNTIIIWNALKFPERLSIIREHSGLVKGVVWDPVGKYLASQSDDKTLRVWRVDNDWKEEVKITSPFVNCGGTTHVLRLSWSPDGRFIVSAHSLNNDGPTAHIIDRNSWTTGMDFVGHRKAIEVVCFNPHLFIAKSDDTCNSNNRETTPTNHGCLAIGSRDRSLSIWLTSLKRPLVVIHELFTNSILDISWSSDGYKLMACSLDGTMACVSFTEGELGVCLNRHSMDEMFLELYGSKTLTQHTKGTSQLLIEDPSMLSVNPNILNDDGRSLMETTPIKQIINEEVESIPIIKQQVESRTPDGRRRIKPVMLTSSSPSLNNSSFGNTLQATSTITTPTKTTPIKDEMSKMDVDGVKSPPARPISFAPLSPRPSTKTTPTKPKESPARSLAAAKALINGGDKRPLNSDTNEIPTSKSKRQKRIKGDHEGVKVTTTKTKATPTFILDSPELKSSLCLTTPTYKLEVTNMASSGILTCKKGEESIWSCPLLSPCLVLVANEKFTCNVLTDNTCVILSTQTGRLLISRILLAMPPYKLQLVEHHLLIATINGTLSVYDLSLFKVILKGVSFSHMITSSISISDITLTKTGLPVVMTTVGGAYAYHTHMELWIELKNAFETSEIYTPNFPSPSLLPSPLPLQSIQYSREDLSASNIGHHSDVNSTLMFLESQLCRCVTLSSSLEYEYWLKSYVTYLVSKDLVERLREYCVSNLADDSSNPVPLYQRREVMGKVLNIIASNTKLQRLYAELKEMFNY